MQGCKKQQTHREVRDVVVVVVSIDRVTMECIELLNAIERGLSTCTHQRIKFNEVRCSTGRLLFHVFLAVGVGPCESTTFSLVE